MNPISILPTTTLLGIAPLEDEFSEGAADAAVAEPSAPAATVLIVDDDDALRKTAAMILEFHGYRTLTASHGLEALDQVQTNPQISAVLLDLHMPVMNGEEAYRHIRILRAGLPVVVVSGFAPDEIRGRFATPPPDGFLRKPFTFATLGAAVQGVAA
jgi:CheY-like chemotaxis protein